MFTKIKIIALGLLLVAGFSKSFAANDSTQNIFKPKMTIGGFVNSQLFHDSRQVAGGRENLLDLYPAPTKLDPQGTDLNKRSDLGSAAMMSRVNIKLEGLTIGNAKILAFMEGDFTGQTNSDNNGFRLRHAYIRSTWEHFSILMGQYWNPFNVIEVCPEVPDLNTGAPFRPFSRNPQLRFEANYGNLTYMAVASFQRDYPSVGPGTPAIGATPVPSNIYARNSNFPELDLQVLWQSSQWKWAVDGGMKQLQPRTVTPSGFASTQKLTSFQACAALSYTNDFMKVKVQGVWGQNLTEQIMLGGYVETSMKGITGDVVYANSSQASIWTDLATNFKTWNGGLFLGYADNLGYATDIATVASQGFNGSFYGRGNNMASIWRVSPRVTYRYQNLLLAFECEFTGVNYGTPDLSGKVAVNDKVMNMRSLFSATYFF